ncbi:hypothetical protein BpHYR1_050699 [Brachionus plicatilis]|uniref:Uncharacterized protein n=1 Tax=Brachionus plicatilis TaxID=10195 RepID=A0A3M7P4H8_BRAPC|nr:hypothetical protein BpHYR1_050699 [Brachionus plicatilis]
MIILPHLFSFSDNGPNYYDPFNGMKLNWQEIKASNFSLKNIPFIELKKNPNSRLIEFHKQNQQKHGMSN